jgi:luciferase-like monooxygenase
MPVQGAHQRIAKEIETLPGVTVHAHRFGGTEFRLGRRELGHVHGDYQADIPFPMTVRNQAIADRRAEPHHVLPESGWVTLRFRRERDVETALDLFRLSYELAQPKKRT